MIGLNFLCERLGGRPFDPREFPDVAERLEVIDRGARDARARSGCPAAMHRVVCRHGLAVARAGAIVAACLHEQGFAVTPSPSWCEEELPDASFLELFRDGVRGTAAVLLQRLPTGEKLVILDAELLS